jgi:hypothetical protein
MKKTGLILMALLAQPLAWAGGKGGGNGGHYWVCRDKSAAISKAEIMDLYEAEHYYGLTINRIYREKGKSYQDYENVIEDAISRLEHLPPIYDKLVEYSQHILETFEFNPVGVGNGYIDDAKPLVVMKGCIDTVVINYRDDEEIQVDAEIMRDYAGLSVSDYYAGFVHEAIYKVFRDYAGAVDSVLSRKMVGYLFRELGDDPEKNKEELNTVVTEFIGSSKSNRRMELLNFGKQVTVQKNRDKFGEAGEISHQTCKMEVKDLRYRNPVKQVRMNLGKQFKRYIQGRGYTVVKSAAVGDLVLSFDQELWWWERRGEKNSFLVDIETVLEIKEITDNPWYWAAAYEEKYRKTYTKQYQNIAGDVLHNVNLIGQIPLCIKEGI